MVYNTHCRSNPIKVRLLNGGYSPAVMPPLHTGIRTESMKGGMLMKSKHFANGKEITICDFRDYLLFDNFLHKSRVTALAKSSVTL